VKESLESGVWSLESEGRTRVRRSMSDAVKGEQSSDDGGRDNSERVLDPRLQTSDLRPQTSDLRPQTSDPRPQTPDSRPQTPDSRLQTPDSRLVVEGVSKSFRDASGGVLEVLRGVSFELGAGEMAAVLGESGAGKTTLLHILGGLEEADAGSVRLGGFDVMRAPVAELARWRGREVGFVFQSHRLLADLSAEENVALPLMVARRSRREALKRAREMLECVGLAARAAHAAGELSGGEQQRVALARALVTRPRLVLADEPTGNLDANTGDEVGALLLELCREARACVLVATHNERLARLCDRRLVLRGGRLKESEV
jgi:lipoprotein-releasing system ATP-binding protein